MSTRRRDGRKEEGLKTDPDGSNTLDLQSQRQDKVSFLRISSSGIGWGEEEGSKNE